MSGFDLGKINASGPDPVKPSDKSQGFDLNKIGSSPVEGAGIGPGAPVNISFDDFRFQPKINADNYTLRAQDQKWYEQLGLGLGNAVLNTATGLAEGIGYLGALATEWGDDRDYSNALTETMQSWKNPLGEIYRERPNQVFDLADSAWWFENIQQLAESAGAFAIEGAALGKLFGGIATKAAGAFAKSNTALRSGINSTAHVATAATLAYTEGAMSGYRVYDSAYKFNYSKLTNSGVDSQIAHEEARRIASKAAATTVQMNTIMNTALGLTALAPMFRREEDLVEAFIKKKGAGAIAEGESLASWKSRLKAASFNDPELKKMLMHRQGITSLASQSLQEGIEEVNTQYAEQEGKRVGEGTSNKNMLQQLTSIGQYFNDVTNEEGALNFVLGAVGGVAQTVLLDHIPTRQVLKYGPDGKAILEKGQDDKTVMVNGKPKYQTQLVTAKAANEFGVKRLFENMRDAAVTDIDNYQKMEEALAKAILSKNEVEIQTARNNLFQVGALDAIIKGNTGSWQQQYRNVGELDNTKDLGAAMQPQIDQLKDQLQKAPPEEQDAIIQQLQDAMKQQEALDGVTEAMQKGYARDMQDNAYKSKATEAVADLDHLQKMHERLQTEHFDAMNPATGEMVDHLFWRKADLYLRERTLQREKSALDADEFAVDASLIGADPLKAHLDKASGYIAAWDKVMDKMDEDVKKLQDAVAKGDTNVVKELVQKYRAQGFDEADLPGAVRNMIDKIKAGRERYKERVSQAEKDMEQSTGFTEWLQKNPGKSVRDFIDTIVKNQVNVNRRANYEKAQADYLVAKDNFDAVQSPKGQAAFMKSIAEDKRKMIEAINKRNQAANLANLLRQQERDGVAQIDADTKAQEVKELEDKIEAMQLEQIELHSKITKLQEELAEKIKNGRFKNFNTITQLKQDIKLMTNRYNVNADVIETLTAKLDIYAQRAQAAQATATEVAEQPVPHTPDSMETPSGDLTLEEILAMGDNPEPASASAPVPAASAPVISDTEPNADEAVVPEQQTLSLEEVMGMTAEEVNTVTGLPDIVKNAMDKLEQELKGQPFSYDLVKQRLAPFVTDGIITQATADSLAVTLRQNMTEEPSVLTVPPETQTPVVDTSNSALEIPQESPPDSFPTIFNPELFSDENINEMVWSNRAMTTDAVKGNFSALEYREFKLADGRVVMRNVMNTNDNPTIDANVDTRLLEANKLAIGTSVKVSIDTEWSGQINTDDRLEEDEFGNRVQRKDHFTDYIGTDGKILMEPKEGETLPPYADMPIKIVSKDGITTYLPRVSWIIAQQGASNFRNVADTVWDGEKVITNNVEEQAKRVMAIRKIIAERYNKNPESHTLETRVSDRTDGILMYSGTLNLNTGKFQYKIQSAAKQLPDTSLKFGFLTTEGKLLVDKSKDFDLPVSKMSATQKQKHAGAPVVFIPLANGRHQAVPLETRKLGERKADVATMLRAIELYLLHGTEEGKADPLLTKHLEDIKKYTGFDLTVEDGLRNFINQYYTHTSNFEDGIVRADAKVAKDAKKVNRFMLAIPKNQDTSVYPKTLIKVGTSYSGGKAVYAKLVDGKLDPNFVKAFTIGISGRFKNAVLGDGNLQGMNSNKAITEVRIQADGRVQPTHHADYNAYLKSFTRTAVYGGNKAESGRYIYNANSQVIIDPAPLWKGQIADAQTTASSLVTSAAPVTQTDVSSLIELEKDDFTLGNMASSYTQTVQISPEGNSLNLSTLEDLYNITPDSNKNGKTPAEILQKLEGLGINKLADGYNPFVKCS